MPSKMSKKSRYTEEQLREKKREEMIEGMADREVAFAEYYINDYNIKMAAIKAGYKLVTNKTISKVVRNKQSVIDYIAWLKVKLYDKAMVTAEDILTSYAKYAFYDITDYIEKNQHGKYELKDFSMIDGQIIQEISQTPSGVTVKFPDRLKALDKLENYIDINPYDWKRKIEEKKLKLLEERLVIEKTKVGMLQDLEDDGFLEALERASSNLDYNDIVSSEEG